MKKIWSVLFLMILMVSGCTFNFKEVPFDYITGEYTKKVNSDYLQKEFLYYKDKIEKQIQNYEYGDVLQADIDIFGYKLLNVYPRESYYPTYYTYWLISEFTNVIDNTDDKYKMFLYRTDHDYDVFSTKFQQALKYCPAIYVTLNQTINYLEEGHYFDNPKIADMTAEKLFRAMFIGEFLEIEKLLIRVAKYGKDYNLKYYGSILYYDEDYYEKSQS